MTLSFVDTNATICRDSSVCFLHTMSTAMGNLRPTRAGAMNRKCLNPARRSYLQHGIRWAPALSTVRHGGHYRQATVFSTMERVAGQSFVDSIPKSEPDRPCVEMESYEATLMVQCPDRRGVVAALGQLLYGYNCNIVESDQFTDRTTPDGPTFFQRIVFDYSDASVGPGNTSVLEGAIDELAGRYSMQWDISYSCHRPQVAVLVSRMDHCLYDLLIRHRNGELKCDIPVIVSNHPDLHGIAEMFGITYRHLPMEKGKKVEQEAQINALIEKHNVDLVVLARYMQILSPEFCSKHWKKTINIHHSFLPAFEGARPYHRAHERGVKVIGATAHYATSDLDCGPIIEQDITRISHRDSPSDMIRKGKDLERLVLARAVRWHLQNRVMVHGNKTVVFED